MRLRIPNAIVERWASDLKRAGLREIGGVLFGEQIAEGDFRIVEATRQRFWGGTVTTFKRRGGAARKEILRLHERTGGNPERFNYLGEWHSHPMAPTVPSCRDETTMYELLADQAGAVNFLLLVIVRLDEEGRMRRLGPIGVSLAVGCSAHSADVFAFVNAQNEFTGDSRMSSL